MVAILDRVSRKITVGLQTYPQRFASLQIRSDGAFTEARLLIRQVVVDVCSNNPGNATYFQNSIFGKTTPSEVLLEAQGSILVELMPLVVMVPVLSTPENNNYLNRIPTVFGLSNVDPALFSRVLAEGYWDAGDGGGGEFYWDAASPSFQDGGVSFSSAFSINGIGCWKRVLNGSVTAIDYGAQPLRKFTAGSTILDYRFGGEYADKTLAQGVILNLKFPSLAAAQAWYPHVFSLNQTIDHAAIQEAIEQNSEIVIPEGAYLCRHPISLIRKRRIRGAAMRNTRIKFINCPGFIPRTTADAEDHSYVYSETIKLSDFSLVGNWEAGQPFSGDRCGIRYPQNLPMQQYNDDAPLGALIIVESIEVTGFASHGVQWMELFCTEFRGCSFVGNAGHQFFSVGGNSVVLRGCYAAELQPGYSGFRIYGNALLDSCTGTDSYESWWGHFGATLAEDGFEAQANVLLSNCNIERQHRSIRIVRGGSFRMIGGHIQGFLTAADPYFIFDEGYATSITLTGVQIFSINPDLKQPVAHIKATGSSPISGKYFFERCIGEFGEEVFKSIHFNEVGLNIFGAGETLDIPKFEIAYPDYKTFGISFSALHGSKLYFGNAASPRAILSGIGSPEGVVYARRGSLYTDENTGDLYSKRTTDAFNTGWRMLMLVGV